MTLSSGLTWNAAAGVNDSLLLHGFLDDGVIDQEPWRPVFIFRILDVVDGQHVAALQAVEREGEFFDRPAESGELAWSLEDRLPLQAMRILHGATASSSWAES